MLAYLSSNSHALALGKQAFHFIRRQRFAKQKPLQFMAIIRPHKFKLLGSFYTLCHRRHAKSVTNCAALLPRGERSEGPGRDEGGLYAY